MKSEPTKAFLRDVKNIINPTVRADVEAVILSVRQAESIKDIPKLNLKKMQGKKIHYRIRIRKYRIGIIIDNNFIVFDRCLPRKDFYKYFP